MTKKKRPAAPPLAVYVETQPSPYTFQQRLADPTLPLPKWERVSGAAPGGGFWPGPIPSMTAETKPPRAVDASSAPATGATWGRTKKKRTKQQARAARSAYLPGISTSWGRVGVGRTLVTQRAAVVRAFDQHLVLAVVDEVSMAALLPLL